MPNIDPPSYFRPFPDDMTMRPTYRTRHRCSHIRDYGNGAVRPQGLRLVAGGERWESNCELSRCPLPQHHEGAPSPPTHLSFSVYLPSRLSRPHLFEPARLLYRPPVQRACHTISKRATPVFLGRDPSVDNALSFKFGCCALRWRRIHKQVVPSSDAGIFGCTEEGMGSDIRTKSSVDEHSMAPGTELPPMDVGQGLEIRVFDNFPLNNLKSVYRVIALLAENSRIHHADEYIYDNHGWKASAQEAMKEGWNAILTSEYVHSLESNLHVDLSGLGDSTQAFDVFSEVYAQLIHLRSEGFWTGLLLDDVDLEPVLDNPNRYSWVSTN